MDKKVEMSKISLTKEKGLQKLREGQASLFEPGLDMEWDCMCEAS